ncbi:MAG: ATP phosphoribosyltransferase regulatory subunit, partial [Lachnospiraceae bacterium]|nr:ATP phosphoribosyltransferase regulatory subunit [Lachnospiraceae bacterium]
MNTNILHTPEGVRDLYGSELRRKHQVMVAVRQTIDSFGYDPMETPTFEFFDVFSREVGTTPSRDLYKLFDKDGNTLVMRPDFTPPIARCAAKYFLRDNRPLRLSYEGSTFTNVRSLQGKLQEVTQMGAELLQDDSVQADAEIIALVADCLRACGLENFQISVGHMEYFKGLCEEAGLQYETEIALREAISAKNIFAAEELLSHFDLTNEIREALLSVSELFGSITDISRALDLVHNTRSSAALDRLNKMNDILKAYGVEQYVSYDLGLLSKYHYYTGIIFKAYSYGVGDAIVKGGRYDRLLHYFGKDAPAVGFAVVVDDLMEALDYQKAPVPNARQNETVTYQDEESYQTALKDAVRLRREGKRVVLTRE